MHGTSANCIYALVSKYFIVILKRSFPIINLLSYTFANYTYPYLTP